jgi:integrase/recombinase XerC
MAHKRGKKWEAEVVRNGTRYRRTYPTQVEAQAAEARWRRGEDLPSSDKDAPSSPPDRTTLEGLLSAHADAALITRRTAKTRAYHRRTLTAALPVYLDELTQVHLDDVVAKLQRGGLAPGTVGAHMATLSAALRWGRRRGLVRETFEIERPTSPKLPKALTEVQLGQLMQALHDTEPTAYRIAFVMVYTGLRVSDALALRSTQLMTTEQAIRVSIQKTGEVMILPVPKEVAKIVSEIPEGGWGVTYETFRERLGKPKERGLIGFAVTPHMLRHTAATRLLRATNGNIKAVQRFLGHKSVVTTERYTAFHDGDLRAGITSVPTIPIDVGD